MRPIISTNRPEVDYLSTGTRHGDSTIPIFSVSFPPHGCHTGGCPEHGNEPAGHRETALEGHDPVQLERWIASETPRAVGYCRSIVKDHAAAEDIVQDTFIALIKGGYDLSGNPKPLLYRSLTNRCFNWRRDNRRRVTTDFDAPETGGLVPSTEGHATAESKMELDELKHAIDRSFDKLPERQRAALHLRVRMDMSYAEIASTMNVSEANAQVLVHRGREALKRELADYL